MPRTQRHNAPEDARQATVATDAPLFDEAPPAPAVTPAPAIGRTQPTAQASAPILQWANGKPQARRAGQERFTALIGFHIEAGQDNDLDAALNELGAELITIKHQRPGGSEQVSHWYLGEQLRVYPVTSGPVGYSVGACLKQPDAMVASGIGLRWPQSDRSRMAVMVIIERLLSVGYSAPVAISVRSKMSDVLLGALIAHGEMCSRADDVIDRKRHPAMVTFHELALPLVADAEQEWGRGDTATVVPFRAEHPEQVDAAYLRTVWRPERVDHAARAAWPGIVEWAAAYAIENEGGAL